MAWNCNSEHCSVHFQYSIQCSAVVYRCVPPKPVTKERDFKDPATSAPRSSSDVYPFTLFLPTPPVCVLPLLLGPPVDRLFNRILWHLPSQVELISRGYYCTQPFSSNRFFHTLGSFNCTVSPAQFQVSRYHLRLMRLQWYTFPSSRRISTW
jgi:hypothetical protein